MKIHGAHDPTPDWDAVWAFFLQHEALLRRAIAAGAADSSDDLLHEFAVSHLPRVMTRSATLNPDSQRGYVYSAARNFARTALRRRTRESVALKVLRDLPQPSPPTPDEVHSEASFQEQAAGLEPETLGITDEQSRALRAFFGFDSDPASIREIAASLRLTRYRTTSLIVDGLAAAALRLGHTGALEPEEANACRSVLLDGLSLAAAAKRHDMTTTRVRRLVKHLRSTVANSLPTQPRTKE